MGVLKDYFCGYSAHARWANEMTFDWLQHVADADYHRVLIHGVRSMHHLLNHMVILDELWVCELRQDPPRDDIPSSNHILYDTRAEVMSARRRVDQEIAECIARLDEADFTSAVQYDEYDLTWPVWLEFAHVFRHQVHHRGQMSALLGVVGLEPPPLDPMFFPPGIKDQWDKVEKPHVTPFKAHELA